jgi:FAD:protein FMN transferase
LKKTFPLIALFLFCLALFLWIRDAREIRSREMFITDVFVSLQARGTRHDTGEAFTRAVEEVKRIDARLGYRGSLVDELNRRRVVRDREVYYLISLSEEVRKGSSGAFSVTLRPILDAWGFTGDHPFRIPTPGEFASWKSSPRDEAIDLKPDGVTVEIPRGTGIDIGGTLEGYAADRARAAMESAGCATGLVNVGGEVAAFGDRTWKIGIKHPRQEGLLAVIPLKNRAIATSGDYERFFIDRGRRFCHTLDPATGWPARGIMSATVIAKSCTLANAWAVALFVAGPDTLGPVLEKQGFDWIVVDGRGIVRTSKAMAAYCPAKI